MVLLEDSPPELFRSLTENFDLSDTDQIARINDNLSALKTARQKQQEAVRQALRQLTRKCDIAEQSHKDTLSKYKEANYGEKMHQLDRTKFGLAKSVNELESRTHSLEGQLARLKEELEQVESEDPADSIEADSEAETLARLKLKLYRSLGIELHEDPEKGTFDKAVIRNPSKGDVRIVPIDPNKFTPQFYADFFWQSM